MNRDETPNTLELIHEGAMQPGFHAIFEAFDTANIQWCLLRGEDNLASVAGDVDLLVAPGSLQTAAAILARMGFVQPSRVRNHGIGGHLSYDPISDHWLRVDVESDVTFGRGRLIRADVAQDVLVRRRRQGTVWYPSCDDEFWLLLLHAAWDHETIGPRHRQRLGHLAGAARADGPFATAMLRHAPGAQFMGDLLQLVRAAAWSDVNLALKHLRRAWLFRQPLLATTHQFGLAVRVLARKVGRPLRRPGVSIALVGLDGSGKTTMSRALREHLPFPVQSIYLGLYARRTNSDRVARLGVGFAVRVGRLARASLAAGYHQARGRIVIFDRYTYDLHVSPDVRPRLRTRLRRWALSRMLPDPDVTIFLDADPVILWGRKPERPVHALQQGQAAYRELAESREFVIVDASLPAEDVRRRITQELWRRLAPRMRKRG